MNLGMLTRHGVRFRGPALTGKAMDAFSIAGISLLERRPPDRWTAGGRVRGGGARPRSGRRDLQDPQCARRGGPLPRVRAGPGVVTAGYRPASPRSRPAPSAAPSGGGRALLEGRPARPAAHDGPPRALPCWASRRARSISVSAGWTSSRPARTAATRDCGSTSSSRPRRGAAARSASVQRPSASSSPVPCPMPDGERPGRADVLDQRVPAPARSALSARLTIRVAVPTSSAPAPAARRSSP